MKLSNTAKWSIAISAMLGVAACQSTLSLEGGVHAAGAGGHLKLDYDGRDVKAEDLPGQGNRGDMKFYDKDGNEIPNSGATGVGEGDKVPVPRGATHVSISGPSNAPSCTGCSHGGSGMSGGGSTSAWSGGGQMPSHGMVRVTEKWAHIYTLDGDFGDTTAWSNVSASFTIMGNLSASQIGALISPILLQGEGTFVPSNVTVDTYARLDAEPRGARLVVADKTRAFTSFMMSWNDFPKTPTYDAAPNGWKTAAVFIPLAEINVAVPGIGALNRLDLTWMSSEDSALKEIHESRYFAVE